MAAKRRKQGGRRSDAPLTLEWSLGELPSSQHRAGLASLVMCVRYLDRTPGRAGICQIAVHRFGASLQIDEAGLRALLDVAYAAYLEEQDSTSRWKNVEPLREEERVEVDPKTKKERRKKVFIYERPIPEGGPLLELDSTRQGRSGIWIKLWRDFVWTILRGVPAQREPFESRANGEDPSAPTRAANVLEALCGGGNVSVELPSTYFLGAQATTADNVPFKDRARFQFLLHFWPFAATVYVPDIVKRDGTPERTGFAVCIADVADLEEFCLSFPEMLRDRATDRVGFRPKASLVALPSESGLSTLEALRRRLTHAAGTPSLDDVVIGVDVVHAEKQGNSIRLLGVTRVEPDIVMVDEYSRLHPVLRDTTYRRLRLGNLLAGRPPWARFEAAFATMPVERLFGRAAFAHDAREDFAKRFSPPREDPMPQDTSRWRSDPDAKKAGISGDLSG